MKSTSFAAGICSSWPMAWGDMQPASFTAETGPTEMDLFFQASPFASGGTDNVGKQHHHLAPLHADGTKQAGKPSAQRRRGQFKSRVTQSGTLALQRGNGPTQGVDVCVSHTVLLDAASRKRPSQTPQEHCRRAARRSHEARGLHSGVACGRQERWRAAFRVHIGDTRPDVAESRRRQPQTRRLELSFRRSPRLGLGARGDRPVVWRVVLHPPSGPCHAHVRRV